MEIAKDLAELLPHRQSPKGKGADGRPIYYLWTFDPEDTKVYIDHNEDRHPADFVTHDELAPHVHHPDTVHGYAYSIKDGWRITDDNHDEVKDPFIVRRVLAALSGKHPPAPLPRVPYHGAA